MSTTTSQLVSTPHGYVTVDWVAFREREEGRAQPPVPAVIRWLIDTITEGELSPVEIGEAMEALMATGAPPRPEKAVNATHAAFVAWAAEALVGASGGTDGNG